MNLKDKINYSNLTLFSDLPIGSIFSEFCFDWKGTYAYKLSDNQSMDLVENKGAISYHFVDSPIIPFADLSGEKSLNPSIVKVSTLNNEDLFFCSSYPKDYSHFFVYHCYKPTKSFYISEYTECRDTNELGTYFEHDQHFPVDFPDDIFVFPLKNLKIVPYKNINGIKCVRVEQKD